MGKGGQGAGDLHGELRLAAAARRRGHGRRDELGAPHLAAPREAELLERLRLASDLSRSFNSSTLKNRLMKLRLRIR